MNEKRFFWNAAETPQAVSAALRVLADEYPLTEDSSAAERIEYFPSDCLSVSKKGRVTRVGFSSTAEALRGTGFALAGLTVEKEQTPFKSFGVMLDVSRNAVMKPEYVKSCFRRLALAGCNLAMLYTEDTYVLKNEPHFGFLRGSYTLEEVRDLDDYAFSLGIELTGCIQTLGHLGVFFRRAGAGELRDTDGILLAGEKKTYDFIAEMLDFWSKACRSRRIHVGMDEAHTLGRGRYMDLHGCVKNHEIFNAHLGQVKDLCRERGLSPMIWSDMYFRMASTVQDYYDVMKLPVDKIIPEEVRKKVPEGVSLVYWDYYHLDTSFYERMIDIHRTFGQDPVAASGLWSWYRFTYDQRRTDPRVRPFIEACRSRNLHEFFLTMWGDDGAYCDFSTVMAGILWSADLAFGAPGDPKRLDKFSRALKCRPYSECWAASELNYAPEWRENGISTVSVLVWDDPLLLQGWRGLRLDDEKEFEACLSHFEALAPKLRHYAYANAVCAVTIAKLRMFHKILAAYKAGDRQTLSEVASRDVPALIRRIETLTAEFRKQWVEQNRYNGMEVIQIRYAGLVARCHELAARLKEFADGKVPSIPEYEVVYDDRCAPGAEAYVLLATTGTF